MNKPTSIIVGQTTIKILNINGEDYVCLTDMVKNYGGDQAIYSWLRNRNTVEFIGIWETLNNPNFKGIEFDTFRKQAGLNSFTLTPRKWIQSTNAIGIISKAGRYGGGTFAHRDIAFEFGSYISPEFKLLIIQEFQRLKAKEHEFEQWDYRRFLAKVNYKLQTSSVRDVLIPLSRQPTSRNGVIYAEEADVINLALFGTTSKEWRTKHPKIAKKQNIRDHATIEQLTVLSNLESTNSMFISQGLDKTERFQKLRAEAQRQLTTLLEAKIRLMPAPSTVPMTLDQLTGRNDITLS
jgi:hypothetical protein